MGSLPVEDIYDVLIVGAGLSGLSTLYHLRKRCPTWRVKIIDAAPDVGGTWYWNCYPGCRFDSESLSYGFSFDKELLEEWDWKETFSAQPDTHQYIRFFANKHNMYKDIQFNTQIKSTHWNDGERTWTLVDNTGSHHTARFFVSCMGVLSNPTLPNIPGIEDFQRESFHTSRWPRDLDLSTAFAGKRVGVIGTGATGIQTITSLSKEPSIKSISVFQRTATWSAPLHNEPITPEQMAEYRKHYDTIFKRCAATTTGFLHGPDPRKSLEITAEEREELWEKLYNAPGFGKWLGVFSDTYTNHEANALYSKFMERKIRARVHDPVVAESLIPTNHGFGTRRVPLESGYFEAFNQSNVHLVDLKKTPITRVTATGILTDDGKEHELDVLIYATGFDAITGSFNAIEWHAKDDRPLIASGGTKEGNRAIWVDHKPSTFLGLTAPSMPNTFLVLGPHQPFGNIPRSIEHAAQVVADLLGFCRENNYTYVEPTQQSVDAWTDHVIECGKLSPLINEVDSWLTGVNTNVKGKTVRSVARYTGSAIDYRKRCEDLKLSGYQGFVFA